MKKILILTLSLISINLLNAQDAIEWVGQDSQPKTLDQFELHAGIASNHLWRGLIISDMPTITTMLSYYFDKEKKFRVGLWGGAAITQDNDDTHYKEVNYFVEYGGKNFTIGIWDLFNTRYVDNPEVLNYDKDKTTHLLDLRTNYFFGDVFPMQLQANLLLYGTGDQYIDEDGDNHQRYSTYVQAAYPIYDRSNLEVNIHVGTGFALDGDTHLYGDGENDFDIVSLGLDAHRNIQLGSYTLPVHGGFIWNPSQEFVRMQIAADLF